jgi:tyrosyl-tRNA synthetase
VTETTHERASELTRNAVDSLPDGGLERKLAEPRPLRVKLGIDPTAPDIHLGHTVVLRKLREFQDLGHTAVLVIGDFTARVGDPSGRSAQRPILTPDEIRHNAETYQQQAFKILDHDRTEVRRNSEWLDMAMGELFGLARTATVAQLLERDDFAKRYSQGSPISILELLYPLLQGYDSVAIDADVELGGTDQKFNLLLARDIQQAYGKAAQVALTVPILPGIDGVKRMSKSEGNYVGVTEPAEEMFGKLMRIPDDVMPLYYELLVDTPFDPDRAPVESKRALAQAVIEEFHSPAAARDAERAFDRRHVERGIPEEIPEADLPQDEQVHLPALIADVFGVSRAEARRLLHQGGVRLNGEQLHAERLDVPTSALEGGVLALGKRRFVRFRR